MFRKGSFTESSPKILLKIKMCLNIYIAVSISLRPNISLSETREGKEHLLGSMVSSFLWREKYGP